MVARASEPPAEKFVTILTSIACTMINIKIIYMFFLIVNFQTDEPQIFYALALQIFFSSTDEVFLTVTRGIARGSLLFLPPTFRVFWIMSGDCIRHGSSGEEEDFACERHAPASQRHGCWFVGGGEHVLLSLSSS